MAKAKISDKGNRVIMALDFDEAAVLFALLSTCPSSELNNSTFAYHTESPFRELQAIRETLEGQDLWPCDTEDEATRAIEEG